MNWAQWFMGVQTFTCLAGSVGFFIEGQKAASMVWLMYAFANVAWFFMAKGS